MKKLIICTLSLSFAACAPTLKLTKDGCPQAETIISYHDVTHPSTNGNLVSVDAIKPASNRGSQNSGPDGSRDLACEAIFHFKNGVQESSAIYLTVYKQDFWLDRLLGTNQYSMHFENIVTPQEAQQAKETREKRVADFLAQPIEARANLCNLSFRMAVGRGAVITDTQGYIQDCIYKGNQIY